MSEQSEQSKQRKIAIVTGEGRGINSTVNPKPLLHLEGAAVLIVSLVAYRWNHGGWIEFVLLFLLPDLSMIGYAAKRKPAMRNCDRPKPSTQPARVAQRRYAQALFVAAPTRAHLNPDRHALEAIRDAAVNHAVR